MATGSAKTAREKKAAVNREMTLDQGLDRARAIEILAELYELLEAYGPSWYTEDLHRRAEAALRVLRDS